MRFYLSGDVYEAEDAKLRRVEDIVRRVEALPGVRSAFASNLVPLSNGGGGGTVIVDGRPVLTGERADISFIGVTPHFNATLGITKTRGRDFTDAEGWSHSPVAIVNQTMAKRFWPDGDALGGRFRLADSPEDRVVHRDRRDARCQPVRHRSVERSAAGRGVRPVRLSADVQYRADDSRRRGSGVDHVGGPLGDSRRRSEPADVPGAHDRRSAPAELLAVRPVRLDLRDDRRHGAAARGDRRLRRAVVLRLAAHAGDRRARGARRRTARHSAASSSARDCCSPASASRSGWCCRPAPCRSRGRSSTTSARSIR